MFCYAQCNTGAVLYEFFILLFWIRFVLPSAEMSTTKRNQDRRNYQYERIEAENQMLWVQSMNSIRSRAEEIIKHELIYCWYSKSRPANFIPKQKRQVFLCEVPAAFHLSKIKEEHTMKLNIKIRQASTPSTPDWKSGWRCSLRSTPTSADRKRPMSKAAFPMCWTDPDCPSVCNRPWVRNADGKQARTPSKPGSGAGRNNVAFRGDMRSKCRVCTRCFDRYCIARYSSIVFLIFKAIQIQND